MKGGWACLLLGLALSIGAQRWRDAGGASQEAGEEILYVRSGEALKLASLGFDGVLADFYWIRTVLYFGRQVERQRATSEVLDLRRMPLLEPLLDVTTELDPHHLAAWRFGSFFLQFVDAGKARRFTERGLRSNPTEWRLYQDLGFLDWRQGRYREAADAYDRGGRIAGAPSWMAAMAATMASRAGDGETARELYRRLCEDSADPFIRQVCEERNR